ncbi:response regulator [Pseudothauera rhizosphaerae]|uniref:histidine kinase n=1 Tax=Pseudothauera rhizosphaerae TaxID=2565932 RepID=A0A4S4AS90_9RHOO|nr:response regulator [Pseudothauera rhizosphaerae]THF62578.1 response regulator [Pseudothauera rhizosphaerae]
MNEGAKEHEFDHGRGAFLATLRPGRGQRRLAAATVAVSFVLFVAAVPFARVQLPQVWAFIPVYQSALVINDLITAVLLYGQFRILRSRALAVLAAGYLYTACMAVIHALTFPGLFAADGLLGAGPQTTAWLYMFWHGGFPLFLIGYAAIKDRPPARADTQGAGREILASLGAVFVLGAVAVLLATAGKGLLPEIMSGNRYTPAMKVVVGATWASSLLGLVALWRRRPHSVLDLWLMVVACAWLFDIGLAAVFNGGRFDLGFYAGRIYGLLAASFVLVVLLLENGELYTQLVQSHRREREKSTVSRRLGAELENLNRELADKNRQLEEASERKSEFLASMSHELRTPLNAIIGFSDVLKDGLSGPLSEQQREYVTDIYTSGRHLLALINDILDLSKVEAGKMSLDLETVEVGTLLESGLSIVREKAANHRIALTCEIEPGLGALLLDPRKTKQILYNLLSNAVKFTAEGGRVGLSARRAGRDEIEHWRPDRPSTVMGPPPMGEFTEFLRIDVDDDAMGIAPEDASRLFQPFSQLDASLARRYEGTGLGLAMVMKLVQLHGGTVALASEPGRGSRFTVWLPWRDVPNGERDAPPPQDDGRPLALVIEDDPRAAELLRLHLDGEGFQVALAGDAESAPAALGGRQPCLIVLDVLLPGVDGWQYLARIKSAGSPWADVPVVIVSIVADAEKGVSLGAAQVLQKPVSRDELAAALDRIGFRSPSMPTAKVLVIDDDPMVVELLTECLAGIVGTVLRADGGRDGIELARRERPDLLVLDLLMPDVSGFDVVEALRTDADTAAIPVIVVTSKDLSAADRDLINGHVTAILEKSAFTRERFAAEVRRALFSERQGAPA